MWLEPSVEAEYFYGFTTAELKEVKEIIIENLELLKNEWNEYFEQ